MPRLTSLLKKTKHENDKSKTTISKIKEHETKRKPAAVANQEEQKQST